MGDNQSTSVETTQETPTRTKFCKYCGAKIPEQAVICTHCGGQVEELKSKEQAQPSVVINNSNASTNSNVNTNTNTNVNAAGLYYRKPKNKWVALLLCIFFGIIGAHKFYEGKIGMGVLYIFTVGLFCVGWIMDIIALLAKPNPYYV